MNVNYNFTSRETYLAVAAEWKANYARITVEARKLRAEYNEAQRTYAKAPWADKSKAGRIVDDLRSSREALRYEASQELFERANMKEKAQLQWEADHAAQPA